MFFHVREHHPLKQGLRQTKLLYIVTTGICQRASSTKTRIKTIGLSALSPLINGQRASSTKTRIKTSQSVLTITDSVPTVREHHPLKQGLRLNGIITIQS